MRKLNAHQCVKRLPSCLACIQALVDFVLPGSHLHSTNEIGLDNCLGVEYWKKGRQVVAHEVWLRTCGRVQGRKCEAADSLKGYKNMSEV